MKPKFQITIDKNKCVGSTLCIFEAPDVFTLDEDRQSVVKDQNAADRERILAAAHACPMNAITIVDGETGQTLWPV